MKYLVLMNKILFYQLLYLQILFFFKLIFIVCTDKNHLFLLLYNVPFSPIITAFLIKLYASFLLIDAKLTR